MKKLLSIVCLFSLLLVGCARGISRTEYNAVVSERDALKRQFEMASTVLAENEATSSAKPTPAIVTEKQIAQTLVDDDWVKIVYTGLEKDSYWGKPAVKVALQITNKSARSITIQPRECSVNGYMVETMMSVDIAAGKTALDGVVIDSEAVEYSNLKSIASIECFFIVSSDLPVGEWHTTKIVNIKPE